MTRRPSGSGGLTLRDGRWVSTGRDPATRRQRFRRWPPGTTRPDAERLHAQWYAEVVRGDLLDRAPTVAVWLERWLLEHDVSESTRVRYRHGVRHVVAEIGGLRLEQARPVDISTCLRTVERKHGAAAAAIARAVLSGGFGAAVEHELVTVNPVRQLKRRRAPAPKADRPVPSTGQVHAIIDSETDRARRTFWATLAGTGARCGEVLALKWEHVDLAARAVTVARTVAVTSTGRRAPIDDTKTHKRRTVPIGEDTAAVLGEWRAELAATAGLTFAGPHGWVFPSARRPGAPWSHEWARSAWIEALERCGIDSGITLHSIRHWYASTLVAAGVRSQTVADLLGNSIGEVERRYGKHAPKNAGRLAVEQLPSMGESRL